MPDIDDIWDDEEDMKAHGGHSMDEEQQDRAAVEQGQYAANAVVNVHLNADSGYTSQETARISADQWARICGILAEQNSSTP